MNSDDQEILDEFLRETHSLLDSLEKKIRKEANWEECLDTLHTIKGTSACLGLKKMVDTCHECESLIQSGNGELDMIFEKLSRIRLHCFEMERVKLPVPAESLNDCLVLGHSILKSMEEEKTSESIYNSMVELRDLIIQQQERLMVKKQFSMDRVLQPLFNYVRENGNKRVVIEGEELMVDASLATVFGNTLIHLISNSLEHGLESVDEGNIWIRCYEKEGLVIVEVEDNGRGVESEENIFERGVSTREDVTTYSGRGIGMSAVKNTVEKAQGRVEVESRPGEGCLVRISLPIPTDSAVVKLMNIEDLGHYYSIPLEAVAEVIGWGRKNDAHAVTYELEGSFLLDYRGHLLPLVHLGRYLDTDREKVMDQGEIVVFKTKSYFYGLIVERVQTIEELVIERVVQESYCSGAALTREGRASLVLDVDKIARDCQLQEYREIAEIKEEKAIAKDFLMFDMGEHKNYVIALEDVWRVEQMGGNYPLICLDEALGLEKSVAVERNILVVKKDGEYYGLVVGSIGGIQRTEGEVDESIRDREGILGVVVFEEQMASLVNWELVLERKNVLAA